MDSYGVFSANGTPDHANFPSGDVANVIAHNGDFGRGSFADELLTITNPANGRLINDPLPTTLHPGSGLNVVIRYIAREKIPRACELAIGSDDPAARVRCLDVLACTIPDCGGDHEED